MMKLAQLVACHSSNMQKVAGALYLVRKELDVLDLSFSFHHAVSPLAQNSMVETHHISHRVGF